MPTPSTAQEQDVLRNQYALGYAQLQTASKALLGPSESDDSGASEDERLLQQRIKPRSSELVGIGYNAPVGTTGDDAYMTSRQESAATQRLRRQLLGKHARPAPGAVGGDGRMLQRSYTTASKPRHSVSTRKEESDEEDEGRASLGRRKVLGNSRSTAVSGKGSASIDGGLSTPANVHSTIQTVAVEPSKKRGSSYLDQVLADRARKRKKNKGNK